MHRLLLYALIVFFCGCSTTIQAADWPQFRGLSANGIAPDTGINKDWKNKPPTQLWNVPMTDDGYAGPAVANGKVFILDHEPNSEVSNIRALDMTNGKQLWMARFKDAKNANYGFSNSTPLIDRDNVYLVSCSGRVMCLDSTNQEKPLVWEKHLVNDFKGKLPGWRFSMSPVLDGDNLIVQPGGPNAAVVALNKTSGKTVWQGGGSDPASYATPVVATIGGKKQYVIFTTENIMGVDPTNGKRLWASPWKTGCDVNAAAPIVIGNTIFITSGYGHGCGLVEVNGTNATLKWENKEIASHFNSPVLVGGMIYSTSDKVEGSNDPNKRKNGLTCLDPATGNTKWRQPGFEKGGLIAVDGTIIVLDGGNGDVVMVSANANAYQELGRIKAPLGGQSWTAPIISNGKLLIRNKSTLACYDLK